MVASSSDGTVTDLGTLVIIDDDEEDTMGTMKSGFLCVCCAACVCV